MREPRVTRNVIFVGSSKKDLKEFPQSVRTVFGHALHIAQLGGHSSIAKPLKGFKGSDVVELIEDHDGDTYRAVYTLQFADTIYVLHAFKKKSKRGDETPQSDIRLIEQRIKDVRSSLD